MLNPKIGDGVYQHVLDRLILYESRSSEGFEMKGFRLSVVWILLPVCMIALIAEASNPVQTVDLNRIGALYGPDIARIYREDLAMPKVTLDSEPLPLLRYRRDPSPCNALFIRENPEMAEECNKARETITIENRYQNKLNVHILDGRINSIDFNIPIDDTDPLKNRKVVLLHDSLVVHDNVMERYSHNHAKIYFFPVAAPRVSLDESHNLIISFGADYIKFSAEDFRKTVCRGFVWKARPKYYRNGTRSVPDIAYRGNQPYMTTVNWSYPPLNGFLDVYNRSKKIGRIPTAFLYQEGKNQRAKPLFTETGLLNYLKSMQADDGIKKRYGPAVQKAIEGLLD